MSENLPPSDQPGAARRFAGFLYRLLRAALITLLFVGLLAGVAWGGLWIYQTIRGEINRATESVDSRFEAQESRLDTLRREMDRLLAAAPDQEQQLRAHTSELESLESALARLGADAAQKEELLTALEAALADNLTSDQQTAERIADLAEALTALQADFNLSTGQIDTLGGELDSQADQVAQIQAGLETAVASAEAARIQAEESVTAVTEMAQSFILFHAWELVARARLHLLSENIGLAANDIATARRTIATLQSLVSAEGDLAEGLEAVQSRLTLAAANLPGTPELAARDLESVWDALDQLLLARLLPQSAETSPEAEATTEAAAEETTEAAAEATVLPTPTLTAPATTTPTPTPTPTPEP